VSKRDRLQLTPDLTTRWATGNDNFVYSSLWDFKSSLTCRKIFRHGTFPLCLPAEEKVCRGFLSPLKIHLLGRVLNPQPLVPEANTLIMEPNSAVSVSSFHHLPFYRLHSHSILIKRTSGHCLDTFQQDALSFPLRCKAPFAFLQMYSPYSYSSTILPNSLSLRLILTLDQTESPQDALLTVRTRTTTMGTNVLCCTVLYCITYQEKTTTHVREI
jgi:hypothetical protein